MGRGHFGVETLHERKMKEDKLRMKEGKLMAELSDLLLSLSRGVPQLHQSDVFNIEPADLRVILNNVVAKASFKIEVIQKPDDYLGLDMDVSERFLKLLEIRGYKSRLNAEHWGYYIWFNQDEGGNWSLNFLKKWRQK